ncbi:sugar transporter [Rhodocollybia butyracea]|uniref:Sugar transporter n=1 Tax=Rhodocollybia butyracea TaxID=206335 RepID=A0A9P5PPY3_9AGAR|nr:sugar transporter [Rhodocollybia butyracea]
MYGYNKLFGAWIPLWLPKSSLLISVLLVSCSSITSTTFGYDASMINGLNILPSYVDYFHLNPATTGLNTASLYIGGCVAAVTWGKVTDVIGRRPALLWAAIISLIAVILQSAAQNVAMFVIARIILGYGTSASGISGPAYLAETLPLHWRGWGLGVFNDFYYISVPTGGLIAAGLTYGTSFIASTWAWRIPSIVQGVFSIFCIIIIPFIPESPRWLLFQGRRDEAHVVLAQTYSNGDLNDKVVLAQLQEMEDTFEHERNAGQTLSVVQIFKTKSARKRMWLAVSAAVFSTIAGNVIASYYLGTMLANAGISSTKKQLQINIILNAFCLCCSVFGTYFIDRWGRKMTAAISTSLLTVFLFLVGALTKVFGNSNNTSGVYATVGMIFLFQGAYSIGWTPVLYLYPPEVLNYPIRANGMGVFTFFLNATALLIVFTMPIALVDIGWKTYMINGSWDIVMLGLILYYWIETKGKTLEEIDELIDGDRHTDVPDLARIIRGEKEIQFGYGTEKE